MTLEEPAENASHAIGRLLLVQALQPGTLEGLRIGLEDPGRASHLILIGVGDERAPLGFLENEGEGIERPGRTHPGEHIGPKIHLGLEVLDISVAEAAVDAVGQHHEIGIGKAGLVLDVGFEHQGDAEFARPLLQDQKQLATRAAAEAIAADPVHRAAKVHGDIIPIGKLLGNAAIARGIVFLEIVQRGIGKHHAKAEGVVGAVTLIHRDLGVWPLFFKQDRSVETGRSATDDRDLHESLRRSGTIRIVLNLKHFVGKTRRPFVARMERSAIRDSLGTRRPPGFAEFIIGRAFARPVGSTWATLVASLNCLEMPASPYWKTPRMRGRNPLWSCRAPARSLRPRSPPPPTSPIPSPACAWSWCWRRSAPRKSARQATAPAATDARAQRCG